jgi:hypothetical protein
MIASTSIYMCVCVCVCDMRSSVKEGVLFNTCSLLHIRLLGSSCQWNPVVWCTGSADWYWWRMTNSMYSVYITGHYETSHALHSCAAGDLVLCNVRDTSSTTALLHMWCVLPMWKYIVPEMHKGLTLSDVKTGECWLVSLMFWNRWAWYIVGWKCYI